MVIRLTLPIVMVHRASCARVCGMLEEGERHRGGASLAVEMLIKLCLFSQHSYALALQARVMLLDVLWPWTLLTARIDVMLFALLQS